MARVYLRLFQVRFLYALMAYMMVLTVFVFCLPRLHNYAGAIALVFSLVYLGLGRFVGYLMPSEEQTRSLFYSTAVTFAVLMIPF